MERNLILGVEEQVSTPKEPSPTGDNVPGPSPVVQSSSSLPAEVVAGPLYASPLDDFKEYQVLLRRVASNSGLEMEEMAEQSDTLFNLLMASAPAWVVLPVYDGILNIAKAL